MFRYFLQRFFFQIIAVAAAVGFVGVFFYASSINDNNPAPRDVKTQFAQSLGKAGTKMQAGEVDIANKHLSEREVATILEAIIAESLSFNSSNYDRHVALMENYFTPQGYSQYKNYLAQTTFGETIKSQNLQSGAFTERPPLEVNALVQNGAYKWLFEVPVTLSLIPLNSETYRDNKTKAQNQRFTLRVQFTRVKDAKNPNKIRIEIWQVMAPRK